jgi:arsenical pump membrane protein
VNQHLLAWSILLLAAIGIVTRPFKWPELVWAVSGAALIVLLGLLPVAAALRAVDAGTNVYLFLTGMMLLAEVGRREGLFDWAAVLAVNRARGSPQRLFLLIYAVGTLVTVFLSNDATAVVLTPAVFAAARRAQMRALPLLLVCAFTANAASFVLPISNPANIVLYGNHVPALGTWLARFTIPAATAVIATFVLLRWTQRQALPASCKARIPLQPLGRNGKLALAAIGATAAILLVVSAFDIPLGLPTAITGIATVATVQAMRRDSPWPLLREVQWGILPLVGALFVLVATLDHSGVTGQLARELHALADHSETAAAIVSGTLIGFASNLVNNLPAGLIASSTVALAQAPHRVTDALLIGVDVGPNLSITGSLATILWLNAIRREGEDVGFWTFFKVGVVVMPITLLLAIVARILAG